jgi:hypothetical protein
VTDKRSDNLGDIEAAQAVLRTSIETMRGLVEKAENLLQNHKRLLEQAEREKQGRH